MNQKVLNFSSWLLTSEESRGINMIYSWSVSGQIGHIPLIAKQSLITFWRKKIMRFAQSGARCGPAGISLQKLSTAHAKSRRSHWSRHRPPWLVIGGDSGLVHLSCPGTKLVPDKPSKLSHTFRCRRLQINLLLIGQQGANLFAHWSLGCVTRVRLTRGRAWKMHLIIIRPTHLNFRLSA